MTHDGGRRRDDTSRLRDVLDETLLARFAGSDPVASAAFVERFGRRVFGLALTIVGDAKAAEDVAQEALVRAWRHAAAFDARRASVLTWLLTITRNAAIDSVRARRAVTLDPDDRLLQSLTDPRRGPADVVDLHDDVARLHDALARLPDAQRRAVVLAGLWGLSAREIAEREGIPVGTAKTRIRIALRRLRVALVRPARDGEGRADPGQESRSNEAFSA